MLYFTYKTIITLPSSNDSSLQNNTDNMMIIRKNPIHLKQNYSQTKPPPTPQVLLKHGHGKNLSLNNKHSTNVMFYD